MIIRFLLWIAVNTATTAPIGSATAHALPDLSQSRGALNRCPSVRFEDWRLQRTVQRR
jgi:hypothetical protein